jgi:hypothetical protein
MMTFGGGEPLIRMFDAFAEEVQYRSLQTIEVGFQSLPKAFKQAWISGAWVDRTHLIRPMHARRLRAREMASHGTAIVLDMTLHRGHSTVTHRRIDSGLLFTQPSLRWLAQLDARAIFGRSEGTRLP